jgi:predicted esterase
MQVKEDTISVQKKARYCTFGKDITTARRVWFACHGYGMLAKYFIKKFSELDPDTDFVICPEGLHRFYLEGFSGRVGATWMTSEARLDDIADYVTYLDKLHESLGLHKLNSGQQLIHFGFSQGVATISRYIAMGRHKPHSAVFWAGIFPPDLDPVDGRIAFANLPVFTCLGLQDPFVNAVQKVSNEAHFAAMGIAATHLDFEGQHDIPQAALLELMKLLI